MDPRTRALEAGSIEHYQDPAYYQHSYRARIEDVAYYVQHALNRGGRVFEFGIGNGRIALPLARHGVCVHGIDRSEPMLADLRARLTREAKEVRARVHAKLGDMRTDRGRGRFENVYCAFNTALHLHERHEIEAFFAAVRRRLAPDGELVMDLSVPIAEDLARDPERAYHAPRFRHPRAGVVRYREHFDYDAAAQSLLVTMHFSPISGAPEWTTRLSHRQFYPREWEALLHYNGFEARAVFGDFDGGPLTRDSDTMIWHARKRRR